MTPTEAALHRRTGSGATNPPSYKQAPAIIADAHAPLPLQTPEQLLVSSPKQLQLFQLLDDLAAAGGALPSRHELAIAMATSISAVSNLIVALARNGLIRIERGRNMQFAAIQIVGSGKCLRS